MRNHINNRPARIIKFCIVFFMLSVFSAQASEFSYVEDFESAAPGFDIIDPDWGIVEAHDGEVTLRNHPQQGLVAEFYLPYLAELPNKK